MLQGTAAVIAWLHTALSCLQPGIMAPEATQSLCTSWSQLILAALTAGLRPSSHADSHAQSGAPSPAPAVFAAQPPQCGGVHSQTRGDTHSARGSMEMEANAAGFANAGPVGSLVQSLASASISRDQSPAAGTWAAVRGDTAAAGASLPWWIWAHGHARARTARSLMIPKRPDKSGYHRPQIEDRLNRWN